MRVLHLSDDNIMAGSQLCIYLDGAECRYSPGPLHLANLLQWLWDLDSRYYLDIVTI